ncbi:kininogen-1 [Mixophyes fleayi]|uniref:kininogen-1 n=1 Tax=Mixophyes fleayi TaxID=3061075 RepID=UPI003F4DAAF2
MTLVGMGLLHILILSSCALLSSASQAPTVDADCDDLNIFEATDEALRSYNNAKAEGNQFVLYRITDAKIKNEGDGQMHYFVQHEIHEGSCGVKSGKTWQECDFLSSNGDRAKCSAHVVVNKELKLKSVVTQNCSSTKGPVEPPITAVHHQCLGCPRPIDLNNEELLYYVHSTIEQMNTEGSHPFYFGLESIVNASSQVVKGWDYNINYLVRQTNCLKSNVTSKNLTECKIDKKGESGECTVNVSLTPDGNINDLILECKSKTGLCLTCPVEVDPQDPELLSLLRQIIDEYNSNSNHTELYSVSNVMSASKQGFHEVLYNVAFTIKPTNCSKPAYTILGDECGFLPNANQLSCNTEMNVTDQTMNVLSAPSCNTVQYVVARIGLSPFRRARTTVQNSNVKPFQPIQKLQQPKRHEHNNKGQKHGRREKQNRRKPNHGHKYDDSSEELADNGNEASVIEISQNLASSNDIPVQQTKPIPSNMPITILIQEVSPDTTKTTVLDLPAKPSVVDSRCPGTVWQPIRLIPKIPTARTFTIDDLASAIADLTAVKQDIEENEPASPKQISLFNDEDLLLLE